MATVRNPFTVDLGSFISDARSQIQNVRSAMRSTQVQAFNTRVTNEGLDYGTQLTFWKALKDEESNSQFSDPTFIQQANDTIDSVSKLKRADDYKTAYQAKLDDAIAQHGTYLALQDWLNTQLSNTTDPDLKTSIQQDLQSTATTIYNNAKTLVDNNRQAAENDHSLTELNAVNDDINSRISDAIAHGNDDAEAYWKSQQSVVKSDIATQTAQNTINTFTITRATDPNPINALNQINAAIAATKADGIKVTINGTDYADMNTYLQEQRGEFLNSGDSSVSSPQTRGFIPGIQAQLQTTLDNTQAHSGIIPNATLDSVNQQWAQIASRPEMAPYAQQIESARLAQITSAVQANAKQIVDNFNTDLNYKKWAGQLQALQTKYGVDLSSDANNMINTEGTKQGSLLNDIISVATSHMASNGGTWADAVKYATQSEVGGFYSNNEIVNSSIQSLAAKAIAHGANQVTASAPKVTTPAPKVTASSTAPVTSTVHSASVSTTPPTTNTGTGGSVSAMSTLPTPTQKVTTTPPVTTTSTSSSAPKTQTVAPQPVAAPKPAPVAAPVVAPVVAHGRAISSKEASSGVYKPNEVTVIGKGIYLRPTTIDKTTGKAAGTI